MNSMNMYVVFFVVIVFVDVQQYGIVYGFDGFMRCVQEFVWQFMIGKNLFYYVKFVLVLVLYCGKGVVRCFMNFYQVVMFVDIYIVVVVEGILIQLLVVFILGVDYKCIRGDIER